MNSDEIRKVVGDRFYSSLEESGVEITAVPPDQLHAMVDATADSVFAALYALGEGEMGMNPARSPEPIDIEESNDETGLPDGEQFLWRGRPYMTLGTIYELTNQRLRIIRGLLGNSVEEIELVRVMDTKLTQHAGERMLNVGDISVYSGDPMTPIVVLRNVRDPEEVRELLYKAVRVERKRQKFYFRDDIGDGPV